MKINPYENKRRWKYLLLSFAVVIASGSLLYTSFLVRGIAKSERTRAEVWALSMRQLFSSDDNDFYNYVTAVRDSLAVPAIVVDEIGDIKFTRGLDSTKTYLQDPQPTKKKLKFDPTYFRAQLEYMKSQHEPIKIAIFSNEYWLVYYQDSPLLTQLKVFPYIQLTVIAIFLLVAYTAFNSSRKSEQNQVWVGLAKETAHQLGTPISSLMAWIELMKDKFNAENDPLIAEMENDVKRLEIVADRFSKIGSKPILEVHSVYDVVNEYVNYFKFRVSNKISFEVKGDPNLKAGINIPLFDWVLENLMKNAINAIDNTGSITVDIITNSTKKQIYIDVVDTGKGIPKSKFLTVFQPGYTTRKRGWGLGLSLTKRMIENYHEGQIFVKDSELGKGTTFRITLKTEPMGKPQPGDYVPYHETYISEVSDGSILDILQNQQQSSYDFFRLLPADKTGYAYADGKWTIKQALGHLIDTERIMAYRALRFARNDDTPLPGFDQDDYVANSRHSNFEFADLVEEFKLLRSSNLHLFKSFNAEEKQRFGLASGNRVTVNALMYIIAGHELHHIQIIKEHYL